MPTINQQQAGDPVDILADYVQRNGYGINPNTKTITSFSFQDLTPPNTLGSMSITGTGFTYLAFGGETVPTAGTVQTLKINSGFFIPGQPAYVPIEITGLNLSVTQLLLAAQNGEDAVRSLFANLQWTWNGSNGDDSFTGGNLGDYLSGNDGNDVIRGGNGSDTILGDDGQPAGDGNDTLSGDAGNDFIYGYGGIDNMSGGTGDDYMSGGTGNDSINGNEDNDRLYGQTGTDTIIGGTGSDLLDGGSEADTMTGGAGDDTYYADNDGDRIIEANGAGTDGVYSSVSYSVATTYVENVNLTGFTNINASGNGLANAIVGNAGDNIINGGAGADTMTGGLGNDTYYIDNAGDQVIEANGAGADRIYSSVSYSIATQFIENINLTGSANINASGNVLANAIVGNSGDNIINGGAAGDSMAGGLGNDTYYVDNAGDRTIEANGAGTDRVYSSVSYSVATTYIENINLTGSANINASGNGLGNVIVGNSGNNILNGGVGNDALAGGAGSDYFVFTTALANNVDLIADYNVAADTIWVDNAVFTALGGTGTLAASAFHIGAAAHDADDRIIYNSSTGALFYDSNGSAAGGAVQFATLSKGLAMTNADFLII